MDRIPFLSIADVVGRFCSSVVVVVVVVVVVAVAAAAAAAGCWLLPWMKFETCSKVPTQ